MIDRDFIDAYKLYQQKYNELRRSIEFSLEHGTMKRYQDLPEYGGWEDARFTFYAKSELLAEHLMNNDGKL